jgi:hypothetical protein
MEEWRRILGSPDHRLYDFGRQNSLQGSTNWHGEALDSVPDPPSPVPQGRSAQQNVRLFSGRIFNGSLIDFMRDGEAYPWLRDFIRYHVRGDKLGDMRWRLHSDTLPAFSYQDRAKAVFQP